MPEFALRLADVVKRHGRQPILNGISLDLVQGECVGLAGVNGTGKTTLLKCLLDLCSVDGGRITLFGSDHRQPSARSELAYLPERCNPPAYMNGNEYLRYLAALHGQPCDAARRAAMLAALELAPDALDRPVRQLSKGMVQKLALAGCLLLDKRLYVLDEPASGLDPQARALFKRALRQARAGGAAVLMTSHALADIDELCDRIVILHDGALRFDGTADACCAHFGAADLEGAFLAAIA